MYPFLHKIYSDHNAGTLASWRKGECVGARLPRVRQCKERAEVHHIFVNMALFCSLVF